MWNFLIEEIILHLPYTNDNIKKILKEGTKHDFFYYDFFSDSSKKYLINEAVQIAQKKEYDSILKKWFNNNIYVDTVDSSLRVRFSDTDGLLTLSLCNVYDHKTVEDEWGVYPDSHYYLRQALKLCAPFCIKSIETTTMD